MDLEDSIDIICNIIVVIAILLQSSISRHGLEIYFTRFNNQFLRSSFSFLRMKGYSYYG